MPTRILLIDDDAYTRQLFKGLLRKDGVELVTALNATEGRSAFRCSDFNLVILDQRLPDGNGLQLFTEMRSERARQVAILAEKARQLQCGIACAATDVEHLPAGVARQRQKDAE